MKPNKLMIETMKRLKNKVLKLREEYECACEAYESKIREVCDFNARLVFCSGDGQLVLNEDTASVATLNCLDGRTRNNKLTSEEHYDYCI